MWIVVPGDAGQWVAGIDGIDGIGGIGGIDEFCTREAAALKPVIAS